MLSILIPVYNFDVRGLVSDLRKQSESEKIPFEIICADDASNTGFQKINKEIADQDCVTYIQLDKNIGRAEIRNFLAEKAAYPYLLFLDCDSGISNKNFIKNYLSKCRNYSQVVVCGGRTYPMQPPKNKSSYFHWYYGKNREVRDLADRQHHPYVSFMTNNFLITKNVLKENPFNTNIKGYGHEDTLMGFLLKTQKIPVLHIDNPIEHIGIENTKYFLVKSRQALNNLKYIDSKHEYSPASIHEDVKLLKYYNSLRRFGADKALALNYKLFKGAMLGNLLSKRPNLRIFDLYKLSYLATLGNPDIVNY